MTMDSHDYGMAEEGMGYPFHNGGQDWLVSWHAATSPPPDGKNHGAAGFCFTPGGEIVLVSADGASWEPPAGRPEPDETLRQTLEREVLEERPVLRWRMLYSWDTAGARAYRATRRTS
jgi:hypothetical protein